MSELRELKGGKKIKWRYVNEGFNVAP